MPTYTYRCEQCGETFEQSESVTTHLTEKPRCPKCGGEQVGWVPQPFYAVTGKKS
jgi:putative FmdB family regulatory protein